MIKTYQVSELPKIAQTQSQTQITHRHAHYTKLCEYIASLKLCNGEKLPSCRKIAEVLQIGKSCINGHMKELMSNGWIRRIVDGYSWRSVTYNITLSKQEAIQFLEYLAALPRKKKKRSLSCDYTRMDNGTKLGHWSRGENHG